MALLGALVGEVVAFEHKDVVDHELIVPSEFDVENGSPENVVTGRAPETEEKKRRLPNNILDVLRLVVEGLTIDQYNSLGAVDMKENEQVALGDEIVHDKVSRIFEEFEMLVCGDESIPETVQVAVVVDELDYSLSIFMAGHRLPRHVLCYTYRIMYLSR